MTADGLSFVLISSLQLVTLSYDDPDLITTAKRRKNNREKATQAAKKGIKMFWLMKLIEKKIK